MAKLHHFRNFLKKITPLLFMIFVLRHLCKVSNRTVPTIIEDLFTRCHHSSNLHSKPSFAVPCVRTVHIGQSSIKYYGPLFRKSRRVSRGGGGFSCPFSKIRKSVLIWRKKCPDCGNL